MRYLVIAESDLVSTDDLSYEAVQRYYEENQASFFNPEQIVADYILLDLEDFVVSVDESVVRDQFEAVKTNTRSRSKRVFRTFFSSKVIASQMLILRDALILCRIDLRVRGVC